MRRCPSADGGGPVAAPPNARIESPARRTDAPLASEVLRGEASWWIPEIRDMTFGKFRADEPEGMQAWAAYLQAGVEIPPDLEPILAQIVTCVVFDVVIDNADRWTGNNTKGSPDRKTLYFMDNTLAFSIYTWGHEANLTPLRAPERLQRSCSHWRRVRNTTHEAQNSCC